MSMTREEADKLQELLDDYVTRRDESKDKYFTLGKEKIKVFPRFQKMQLAATVEPFIPKLKPEGSFDLTAILGPILGILEVDEARASSASIAVRVVDGYSPKVLIDIGREEYEKRYCVMVPFDVVKEALSQRTNRVMMDVIGKSSLENKGEPN